MGRAEAGGLCEPGSGSPAQHVVPSLLPKPLTRGQTPYQIGTAAFEGGARHDASRTSFQAASWRGWRLPQGREMTSPRGGAGSEAPPQRALHVGGGGCSACSSLSPSSHPGDKGKILWRRWDGKAQENRDPGSAHVNTLLIEFNRTQGRHRDGSGAPVPGGRAFSWGSHQASGGRVGPGGGLQQLPGCLPQLPILAREPREQSLPPLPPLGERSLVLNARTMWRMCHRPGSLRGQGIKWGQQKRTGDPAFRDIEPSLAPLLPSQTRGDSGVA